MKLLLFKYFDRKRKKKKKTKETTKVDLVVKNSLYEILVLNLIIKKIIIVYKYSMEIALSISKWLLFNFFHTD